MDWWANNQDLFAERFESAAAEGQLQRGSVLRQAGEQNAAATPAIPLDPEDVARVRTLAPRQGLRYDTYLKVLLHQTLDAEERKQAS